MPTLNQIKNRVNSRALVLWNLLQTRQETYLQNNGIYWQGLITPSQLPEFSDVDDSPLDADNTDKNANSHDVSWDIILPEIKNTPLSAQIRVDTYEAPNGHGYSLTLRLIYNGQVFSRTKQHGPETWRDENWHELL